MEAREILIADTGILVAAIDQCDRWHPWVRQQLQAISQKMLTCEAVLTETCFILGKHSEAICQLSIWIETGNLLIDPGSQRAVSRALEWMGTYSNVPMSYADACIVGMVEARPGARVFTLDSDFQIYRQRNRRVIPLIAPFV